jgi:hypothetical protein
MNLAASVIRCSPRKGMPGSRHLVRMTILITASAAAGWILNFTRHHLP